MLTIAEVRAAKALDKPYRMFDGLGLLADRGYFDRAYLREVSRHGGQFVVRAQRGINPVIEAVHSGARGAKVIGRKLKDVVRHLSKDHP